MSHRTPGLRDHAPPGPERLLAGLTPEQAQAVTFRTGPLLLMAGPGARKTRTPTHRAAYSCSRSDFDALASEGSRRLPTWIAVSFPSIVPTW